MSQGMAQGTRMVSGSLEPDSRVPMSTLRSQGPGPRESAHHAHASLQASRQHWALSWHFQSVHPPVPIVTVLWEGTHCAQQSNPARTLHAGQGEGVLLPTSPVPTSRLLSPGPEMTPGAPARPRPLLLWKAPTVRTSSQLRDAHRGHGPTAHGTILADDVGRVTNPRFWAPQG